MAFIMHSLSVWAIVWACVHYISDFVIHPKRGVSCSHYHKLIVHMQQLAHIARMMPDNAILCLSIPCAMLCHVLCFRSLFVSTIVATIHIAGYSGVGTFSKQAPLSCSTGLV